MTVLGIHMGPEYVAAACVVGDATAMIMPREGQTMRGIVFPSFVEFDTAGNVLHVGKLASERAIVGGSNTVVWGVMRLIGLGFEQARQELGRVDYPIKRARDGGVLVVAGPGDYTPEDIAAIILQKVWNDAIDPVLNPIGDRPTKVAVSHPANFDSLRVQAIKEAAERVFQGAQVEVVSEPLAAALAYGVEIPPQESHTVCVLDWGAGAMDAVIGAMAANEAGEIWMSPEPARGKANLGGMDIDDLILDWAIAEHGLTEFARVRTERASNADAALRDVHRGLSDLRRQLERAKIRLSQPGPKLQEIDIPYERLLVTITLTREKLEEILETPLSRERLGDILQAEVTAEKLAEMHATLQKTRPRGQRGTGVAPPEQEVPEAHPEMIAAAERIRVAGPDGITVGSIAGPSDVSRLPSLLDVFRLITLNSLTLGGSSPEEIDTVLLLGDPMHMPCVREAVKDVFYRNPKVMEQLERIDREGFPVNPMECVARGAALYARGKIEVPAISSRDYALTFGQYVDGERTFLLCRRIVELGTFLPAAGSLDGGIVAFGSETVQLRTELLVGDQDWSTTDPEKRIWWRKGCWEIPLMVDPSGRALFRTTLRASCAGIDCVCYDKVAQREYFRSKLNAMDGERLDEGKITMVWL